MKRTAIRSVLPFVILISALVGCDITQPAAPERPTPTAAAPGKIVPTGQRVIAEGRVVPARRADLSPSAAGAVAEVLVAEGDLVKKDQPLLRVDAKRQAAAVEQAEAAIAKAKGAKTGAEAMVAKARTALARAKAGARAEDVDVARAALAVAQAELARLQSGADTASVAKAKADLDKAARAVQQAQFAYDRVKDTPFGNIGPEALRLEQATIDYDLAKTLYEQLALGPRESELAVAKARIALAQATLAQSQAGARPEDVANAEADLAVAEAALKNLDADVASATAALKQAQAALADTELRAPFEGEVAALNVKAGEMIPPTGFAVRLADTSAWEIETTDLTELNVAEVQPGTAATMTFDALPGLELKGKVRKIRTVGESRQGDIVYTVIVSPDQHSPRLRWNMTAKVTLEGAVQR